MADARAEVVAETPGSIVVALRWRELDHPDASELFQVLRLRDGKVFDMQDYPDRHAAMKAVAATT